MAARNSTLLMMRRELDVRAFKRGFESKQALFLACIHDEAFALYAESCARSHGLSVGNDALFAQVGRWEGGQVRPPWAVSG